MAPHRRRNRTEEYDCCPSKKGVYCHAFQNGFRVVFDTPEDHLNCAHTGFRTATETIFRNETAEEAFGYWGNTTNKADSMVQMMSDIEIMKRMMAMHLAENSKGFLKGYRCTDEVDLAKFKIQLERNPHWGRPRRTRRQKVIKAVKEREEKRKSEKKEEANKSSAEEEKKKKDNTVPDFQIVSTEWLMQQRKKRAEQRKRRQELKKKMQEPITKKKNEKETEESLIKELFGQGDDAMTGDEEIPSAQRMDADDNCSQKETDRDMPSLLS